ncbi:MAG: J domain-containing protein [Candidatus Obscuribacter sp.]|jgi:curved DNA-binding protein CbpA|nr:J domain-containing protein [Candidatus Obscuribacter sp.]MBK9201958.1 J domain-containing protein [Candidatus Obscuribacter sp.]MBK9620244.1 J domain-containing protein [Candidatus Obscuribacter sp.]
MSYQPPPPPPRPGMPGGQGQGQPQGQPQQGQAPQQNRPLNYYDLLQVNRDAHGTIIRYAYRFLAAMYHPDNAETGDAEKFRIITDAWRTLSDEGKRAAYDMSLGAQQQSGQQQAGAAGSAQQPANFSSRAGMPKMPTTGVAFNETEMRIAMLQILYTQRKKKCSTGGASAKMMMDILNTDDMAEMEFNLWYLREKGLIEMGERLFMISMKGVDYLIDSLSKTQILDGGNETEKKIRKANIDQGQNGAGTPNLPATTR